MHLSYSLTLVNAQKAMNRLGPIAGLKATFLNGSLWCAFPSSKAFGEWKEVSG
jgi:hypothetical protein